MADLRALTLWRPWSDAIVRGPKRVENRSWAPPSSVLHEVMALHAGLHYDRGAWPWPVGFAPPSPDNSPTGIIGVARVMGAFRRLSRDSIELIYEDEHPRFDLGAALLLEHMEQDPWFAGPYGWLLGEVVAIDPVPCKGAMGIWRVPPAVGDEVLQRVEAKRGA